MSASHFGSGYWPEGYFGPYWQPDGAGVIVGALSGSFAGTSAFSATLPDSEQPRRSGGVIYEYVSKRKKAPKRIRALADDLEDAYERLLERAEEISAPPEVAAEVLAIVEPFAAVPAPDPYQVDWAEIAASQQRLAAIDAAIERAFARLREIEEEDDMDVLLLAA